jgi:hypothetical protein
LWNALRLFANYTNNTENNYISILVVCKGYLNGVPLCVTNGVSLCRLLTTMNLSLQTLLNIV